MYNIVIGVLGVHLSVKFAIEVFQLIYSELNQFFNNSGTVRLT